MSVVTPPAPERDFSRVRNSWMRDPHLTWADKGMLAYIAGHALEHPLTMEQIIAEGAEGADAVRSILRRLERAGWLARTPVRGFRGRVVRYDYVVTEPPPVVDLAGSGPTASGATASGEAATSDDLGKQGVSPGPTACRPTASSEPGTKKTTPPTSEKKKTTEKTRDRAPRGTRLPKDWRPSEELLAWFLAERVEGGRWSEASREALRHEHAQFADYWEAATGARASKQDWSAAWRVWMRRSFPRPIPAGGDPTPQTRQSFKAQDREHQAQGDRKAAAIDALMERNPGLSAREAARLVDSELGRRVDDRTAVPYIDGDATDVRNAREVEAA